MVHRSIAFPWLFLLVSLLFAGCGGGSSPFSSGGGNFADMNFGDVSVRVASTNPPLTSSGGGVSAKGLTGQISRMQLFSNQFGVLGKVAFVSNRDGNKEIYTMNPDGTNRTRLTNNATSDEDPAWSPDGTKIAFSRGADGICVMNADGTNQTLIPNTEESGIPRNRRSGYAPTWSPDGARVAYEFWDNGASAIATINLDGSDRRVITEPDNTENTRPSWSPDGTKIAFIGHRAQPAGIWIMNADGSNAVRIAGGVLEDHAPSWSPDGTLIAYSSGGEVMVMNPDGSNPRNLTNTASSDYASSWSKDGSQIAFVTLRNGAEEIWVMNADGTNQRNLSKNTANGDHAPSWGNASPSRTLIGTGGDLASSASGFLLGTAGGVTKSVFTFYVADFTAVSINALSVPNNTGDSLDFSIEGTSTAVNFSKPDIAYLNLDGSPTVRPFANYTGNLNGLLVSIGAQLSQVNAGKVFLVIPYTAPNRLAGRPSVQIEGGVKVYRGSFPAVFDVMGKNIAPNGAVEIRADSKTGSILSVR